MFPLDLALDGTIVGAVIDGGLGAFVLRPGSTAIEPLPRGESGSIAYAVDATHGIVGCVFGPTTAHAVRF